MSQHHSWSFPLTIATILPALTSLIAHHLARIQHYHHIVTDSELALRQSGLVVPPLPASPPLTNAPPTPLPAFDPALLQSLRSAQEHLASHSATFRTLSLWSYVLATVDPATSLLLDFDDFLFFGLVTPPESP